MEEGTAGHKKRQRPSDFDDGADESSNRKRNAATRQDMDGGLLQSLVAPRLSLVAPAVGNNEGAATKGFLQHEQRESHPLQSRSPYSEFIPNQSSLSAPAQPQGVAGPATPAPNANGEANFLNSLGSSAAIPPSAVAGDASALLQLVSRNPGWDVNSLVQILAMSQSQPGNNLGQLLLQASAGSGAVEMLDIFRHTTAANLTNMLRNPATEPASYLAVNPGAQSQFTAQLSAQLLRAGGLQQAFQNPPGTSSLALSLLAQQQQQSAHQEHNSSTQASANAPELQSSPSASSDHPDKVLNALRLKRSSEKPKPSSEDAILLYSPADETKLSPYQCLARQQLEFFEVNREHLEAGAQGRNRPIKMGQVGIRCKWCPHLPHRKKQRASTYYPAKLAGVYQTAQNITNSHLMQLCQCVPPDIQHDLRILQSKKSGTGGGRDYWTQAARNCGVEEAEKGGLVLKRKIKTDDKKKPAPEKAIPRDDNSNKATNS